MSLTVRLAAWNMGMPEGWRRWWRRRKDQRDVLGPQHSWKEGCRRKKGAGGGWGRRGGRGKRWRRREMGWEQGRVRQAVVA